jgi:hypothetical protein
MMLQIARTRRVPSFAGQIIVAAGILLASMFGQQPVAAAAADQPARLVSDINVITGDSPDVSCPSGFAKNPQDLNQGSGGKYVYMCLKYSDDPSAAIEELYVNYYFASYTGGGGPQCLGNDVTVDGDLNAGTSNGLSSHEGLNFCKHYPSTTGGSGEIANPANRRTDLFSPRAGKALLDASFLKFDPNNLPACNNNACVDTGINGLSYLEVAQTIDPYCQQQFGADWHPIFRPWHYGQTNDQSADVPQDAEVMNLNAGALGAPYIYMCGRYGIYSPIKVTAVTLPDNQPYTAGTWTNHRVSVTFTCYGSGEPSVVAAAGFGGGANQFATSGDTTPCVDRYGRQASPVSFGPVNVDVTPPTINVVNNAGTYALDQIVAVGCVANDAESGVANSTCYSSSAYAFTFGVGTHQVTYNATDAAGNTATLSTTFTVRATPASLKSIGHVLLGSTNPSDTQVLDSYLDAAQANPMQFGAMVSQYQNYLSQASLDGSLTPQRSTAKLLTDLSRGLTAPQSVNDTDTRLKYDGSGWGYYPNRGVGDLGNDVHATTNAGDAVSLTFNGTGIWYTTEKSLDEGQVAVYIDGVLAGNYDAGAPGVHNKAGQVLFSRTDLAAGQHTLTLRKTSGTYMLLDALWVQA